MSQALDPVVAVLRRVRAPWGGLSEAALEARVARALVDAGYTVRRQVRCADGRSRLDLWLPEVGVAIEVKLGRPDRQRAAAQCARYARLDGVCGVILASERSVDVRVRRAPVPVRTIGLAVNSGVAL